MAVLIYMLCLDPPIPQPAGNHHPQTHTHADHSDQQAAGDRSRGSSSVGAARTKNSCANGRTVHGMVHRTRRRGTMPHMTATLPGSLRFIMHLGR